MAVRTIRIMGDPILEKKCRKIEEMTPKIKELITDMIDTMHEQQGVGLAASQVGMLKQIFVIDLSANIEGEEIQVFINPEIVASSGEQTGDEGCLSLPGKHGQVTRAENVTIKALDEDMKPFTVEASGLKTRAILHENDHLSGVLYTELVEGEVLDNPLEEEDEE